MCIRAHDNDICMPAIVITPQEQRYLRLRRNLHLPGIKCVNFMRTIYMALLETSL